MVLNGKQKYIILEVKFLPILATAAPHLELIDYQNFGFRISIYSIKLKFSEHLEEG